ncbi:MAG: alanine racemase [Phototrophicaceae bacterium]
MISLYDLLESANGQLFGEPAAQIFSRFCVDLERMGEDQIFVALRDDYGDSHSLMQSAIERGAAGILCSTPPNFDTKDVSVIVVKDTLRALMEWSQFVVRRSQAKPLVVVGTLDRATTVATISRILSTRYRVLANPDSPYQGRLAIPFLLAELESTHEFIVLELDARQPAEMPQFLQALEPVGTIFTGVGKAYLDHFGTLDNLIAEYRLALETLSPDGLAVINYDNDAARELIRHTKAKVISVGTHFGADLVAHTLMPSPVRTGFDLRYGKQKIPACWTPLVGQSGVYSAMFGMAVGLYYGIDVQVALKQLTEMQPLPGRMTPLEGQGGSLLIDSTYDATLDGTLAALDWLKTITDEDSRTFFVLGDVDHLGDASRLAHRTIGQRAAEVAQVIVTEGDQGAILGRAAQDLRNSQHNIRITYSISDVLAVLQSYAPFNTRDIFLITGGARARMELVVRGLLADEGSISRLPRQGEADTLTFQQRRPLRPSWVEIDRGALANNVRTLKTFVGEDVTLMAVIKADAYGHGAVSVARIAIQNGAGYLAVASMAEALELRDAGITAPILVLSYTPVHAVREAIRHNITITIYDLELARSYNRVAGEVNGKLKAHVKIDSGMGRLGALPEDAIRLFRHLGAFSQLDIEGIYSHFSMADEDADYSAAQLQVFKSVLVPLRAAGIKFKYTHLANSAGVLLGKEFYFNMVRTGLVMYGINASNIASMPEGLRPLMTWKTAIAQVKKLPPGHPIGYGNTYYTTHQETVAVIPVGYADGLRRSPYSWKEVLVRGVRAPIRGRVSMEKTVISVEHIPGVSIGDEVVLLGRQGEDVITTEEVAQHVGTIPYEILTAILARIPRMG